MFDEQKRPANVQNAIPHWPKTCDNRGCESDTVVAILLVRNREGKLRSGAFSQFGYVDKNKNWLLNDGYQFERWDSKCAECYQRMTDVMGISQQEGYLEHQRSTTKPGP